MARCCRCSRGSPCPSVQSIVCCVMGARRVAVSYWTTSPIMCVNYSELSNPLNLPMTRPPAPAPKPQRGRPRDPERVRRILEAAQRHFNEHGLERASLDAIAADAGVAKMTVYSNFGSKEGLFQVVVRDRTAPVVAGVPGAGALDPDQPEQALLVIGARFLELARGDDALGTLRSVYGVAGAQPEFCRA